MKRQKSSEIKMGNSHGTIYLSIVQHVIHIIDITRLVQCKALMNVTQVQQQIKKCHIRHALQNYWVYPAWLTIIRRSIPKIDIRVYLRLKDNINRNANAMIFLFYFFLEVIKMDATTTLNPS